ncbi:hypothetical protein LCGC14_2837620 [marine sediment metagenome]|uniref:Fibronectin type-III domain-containing protein n=1 Tax=marine sediment metagenome TaxID=412755 RepID=A0A0F8YYU1_9ZZZZ
MSKTFNGGAGLHPFDNRIEVPEKPHRPSRVVGQELMLLLLLMPPTDFRVESRTATTAILVWTHTLVTANNIEIDRALGDAAFVNIAVLPGGTTTYTDTGLAEKTRYRYRLRLA